MQWIELFPDTVLNGVTISRSKSLVKVNIYWSVLFWVNKEKEIETTELFSHVMSFRSMFNVSLNAFLEISKRGFHFQIERYIYSFL